MIRKLVSVSFLTPLNQAVHSNRRRIYHGPARSRFGVRRSGDGRH